MDHICTDVYRQVRSTKGGGETGGLGLQLLESVRGLVKVPVGSDRGSPTRPGGRRKFVFCEFSASAYRLGGVRSGAPVTQPSSTRGGTPLCKTPQVPPLPPRLHGEVYRHAKQTPGSRAASGLHLPWALSANLASIRLPLFAFPSTVRVSAFPEV